MNSKYYIELLARLKEEIAKKQPQMKKKKVHFELLPHPPYPPDLVPSDYWQFAGLKRMF